jgi:Ser/Thr protein kinase RdoA (MazF antagonist)
MISSKQLETLLCWLTDRYQLDQIERCTPIASDPLTVAYKLGTASKLYCLKRHRAGKSAEQLNRESGLQAHLRFQGFRLAPPVVPARDGAFYIECEGFCWSLFDFVDSSPAFDWKVPTWKPKHCFAAGAALAELHAHGRSVLAQYRQGDSTTSLGSVVAALPEHLQAVLATLPNCPEIVAQNDRAWLLSKASALSTKIVSLEMHQEIAPLLVHGDYHPGNLLFRNQQIVGVLDFEYAHIESPLYDLGYAALFFCTEKEPAPTEKASLLDNRCFAALISGYRQSALKVGLEPKLVRSLQSAQQVWSLLLPYLEFSCFLTIKWAMQQIATTPESDSLSLRQQLARFHRILSVLHSQA